jgi:uncharacterized protein (DUF433 family)
MSTATAVPHIHLDGEGRAWVDDTNVKAIEVALDHLAYGWGADTIHENHPKLTLAQVYAALAWYYDHQVEMDAQIEAQDDRLRALRQTVAPSSLRLRALRRAS